VVARVGAVHGLEVARVDVLVAGAVPPCAASGCSYVRANMMARSRERGCLRATSVQSGSSRRDRGMTMP
jgi:hypothetical protein